MSLLDLPQEIIEIILLKLEDGDLVCILIVLNQMPDDRFILNYAKLYGNVSPNSIMVRTRLFTFLTITKNIREISNRGIELFYGHGKIDWETIKDFFNDRPWDWQFIADNHNLSWETVIGFVDIQPWDWQFIADEIPDLIDY